ncbi:hypothetical protein JYG36_21190 [Pseudomonas sp. SORT22]|uniref:hypothetical protein n=1 Tax=Pseudomonas sp. SORT22 TaxID=2813842 RepID=UPI001BD1808C|nr:hypothetical protein [Pseudomonas sp. SORT22]QVM95593.1 hypothetical protein JYG36_21190 [Pseudomonas sp. SORT22]
MNVAKGSEQQGAYLHIPYVLIAVSLLPIVLLAWQVPAQAQEGGYFELERFLDGCLLGRVGGWSSLFPLTAKAIGNYIAVAAPVFSVWITVCIMRRSRLQPEAPPRVSIAKYALIALGCVLLDAFLVYQNYFTYTDFATHSRKFRFFGQSVVLFPFVAMLSLLAFYVMTFFSYNLLFRFPREVLARRKQLH